MDGYVAESPNPETYVEQRAYASGNTYADRFLSIKQQSSFSRGDDIHTKHRVYVFVVNQTEDLEQPAQPQEALSISEIQKHIESVLNFNSTQAAKMVGVSRATYYNHRNESQPSEGIVRLYNSAYETVNRISALYPDALQSIKRVLVNGKTLLSWMTTNKVDNEELVELAKVVHEKVQGQTHPEPKAISRETQDKRKLMNSRYA